MWLMLQQSSPDDYVIATGITSTVREFISLAFACAGFTLRWEGRGVDEKGIDAATGAVLVRVDPRYFRPAEVDILLGDPSKAKRLLGWQPRVQLRELVELMVREDLKHAEKQLHLKSGGFKVKDYNE
jgi:GDPmannose 4,6-dehydratase